ncbi:uncharacterized protein TNCV_824611 [Trichonephila clavipes]|nr:uncharacterized protein TNCV_824611 [Trichonephila clavipes]
MRCIGQGLESLKTFCAVMSLPNPVEQKSHDVINNKLSRVMKEVAEESMKMSAVEEYSSSPDNLLTVSGDGTWKTRGHSSLIGVCTVIGAETGDGDTKTFNALSENKPYGDDYLIQKIECVGHVQKRMGTRLRKLILVYSKKKLSDGKTIGGKGRLTDSLIDKLAHYYGNAIRCNSTSVKGMRKAIWAVWGHSCSTDDEPMHWFCPTNPNTWCKYNAAINNNLQNYKHKPSVAKAVRDVIKPVFADLSHPALLKKCLGAFDQVFVFDRGRIVAYQGCGLSFREIDSRVGRNQTTVMRICDRWMQEGTTGRRGRSHPPQCTTSLDLDSK